MIVSVENVQSSIYANFDNKKYFVEENNKSGFTYLRVVFCTQIYCCRKLNDAWFESDRPFRDGQHSPIR